MDIKLLPNEQIKQIEEYPNYYITTFGRVWSTFCGGHWLKPTINKRYKHCREYVSLGRGNKKYIHQLVAKAFIPNPENLTEVDHIDANGLNNHVENLRWVTHQGNMDNEITSERIKHNTGYLCEIEEIETGRLFNGYADASEKTGLCEGAILNHTKNKVKQPRFRLTGRRLRPENK